MATVIITIDTLPEELLRMDAEGKLVQSVERGTTQAVVHYRQITPVQGLHAYDEKINDMLDVYYADRWTRLVHGTPLT